MVFSKTKMLLYSTQIIDDKCMYNSNCSKSSLEDIHALSPMIVNEKNDLS